MQVSGYVLAGGKSSRMGADKALVKLGGVTLIERAVGTLREVCAEVSILTANLALREYGSLVPDLRENYGPIGGIEAALAHSRLPWVLLVAVDMPFVPAELLRNWLAAVTARKDLRVAYFEVGLRPQPGLLLIRKNAQDSIRTSIEKGEYKLLTAIHDAAGENGLWVERLNSPEAETWFTNINTPAALEIAEQRLALRH